MRMIVMDVDGTLTDGKIYIGPDGEVLKAFNVKDGYAISNLSKHQIIPVIMTGRSSKIVEKRAEELKIKEVHQNVTDKKKELEKLLIKYQSSFEEVAYIGDDFPDLEVMQACGFKACPSDAIEEIKEICDFVSVHTGGDGAVREIIDFLLKKSGGKL